MYFARYQETTDYDFYRSEWDEAKGQWGKPERVGPWNTPEQEWGLWVSEMMILLIWAAAVHMEVLRL